MKHFFPLILFTILTVSVFAQDQDTRRQELIAAAEPFEKLGELFRRNVELIKPAVVHITVTQTRSINPGRTRSAKIPVEESGSGFIATIAKKQVIITNRHVVEGMDQKAIQILTHNRQILTPKKITANEDFDIAVIEVAETLPQPVVFGNSDEVHVGDLVLAVGNPFGLDRSVSMGIISATGRRNIPTANRESVPRVGFFQTDAAVNPGSSGGPLLNLRGEVIGILTAIATQSGGNEGVAFVMPINTVHRIAEQLIQTGGAVKPFVGFGFDAAFSQNDRQKIGIDRMIGARIKNIEPNAPADQAGLRVGDVILSFGKAEVEDDVHIVHLVAEAKIGEPIPIQINRDGKMINVTIKPVTQLSR